MQKVWRKGGPKTDQWGTISLRHLVTFGTFGGFSLEFWLHLNLLLILLSAFDFAISADATELPKQVKYSLRLPHEQGGSQSRWRTENTYPNFQAVGPRKDDEGWGK